MRRNFDLFAFFRLFWPLSSTLLDTFLSFEQSHSVWSIISTISSEKAADCVHIFLLKNESLIPVQFTPVHKKIKIIWTKEGKEITECNAEALRYLYLCYAGPRAKGHMSKR